MQVLLHCRVPVRPNSCAHGGLVCATGVPVALLDPIETLLKPNLIIGTPSEIPVAFYCRSVLESGNRPTSTIFVRMLARSGSTRAGAAG